MVFHLRPEPPTCLFTMPDKSQAQQGLLCATAMRTTWELCCSISAPPPSSPVLSLLEDFHRVQPVGLLDRRDAVLLLVQHHGRELRRLPRRLRLWGHHRGGSWRHGWRGRWGSAGGLGGNQLLGRIGWGSGVHHWSWKGRINFYFSSWTESWSILDRKWEIIVVVFHVFVSSFFFLNLRF